MGRSGVDMFEELRKKTKEKDTLGSYWKEKRRCR